MDLATRCAPPITKTTPTVSGAVSGAVSGLVGLVTKPLETLKDTKEAIETAAEYTALCTSFNGFLPSNFILEIQATLRRFGVKPSAAGIMAIPYIVPAIVLGTLSFIFAIARKHLKIIIPIVLILGLIYYLRYMRPNEKESFVDTPLIEKPMIATTPPSGDQYTLINIQPAAVKQLGYVGPKIIQGKFDPVNGIINPISAGVRFLTLQIDYLDSQLDSSKFDDVGVPTLLYRNNTGVVVSSNGLSISDVAKNIVNYAFNPQYPTSKQPLILYLHFVRTPDYISAPDKYIKFLSAVAIALAPIRPMIVQENENTIFSRQQNEKILLYTPLQMFENKIIIMCNVDTTIFRNAPQMGLPIVSPNQDLDSMVLMRVFSDDEKDSLGATTIGAETKEYAVIIPYKRLANMSAKQRMSFAQKGKTRFTIAMPDQMSDPTHSDVVDLMTTTGVNVIPQNLLGQTYQDIARNLTAWDKTPFYMIKPVALQSAQIATSPYAGPGLSAL